MNETKRITVIKSIDRFINVDTNEIIKKKVCAYARVSTNEEDQLNSYENQIDEYTKRIAKNPDWEFAGMYADKGISGTQIKKREAFQEMIKRAKAGDIDLIITKSISRFGRNVIQTLQTVQDLRAINVVVFFEKENLWTDDPKIDFVLTLMSSIAQEESRSISSNIRWSVKKRFEDGKIIMNTTTFLGYDKDERGSLVINHEQAETVKSIFNLFLQGHHPYEIAKILIKENKTTGQGRLCWTTNSVLRILQNEKYCGEAVLQKTYTPDYLTHKSVINDNLVDKYHVFNSHEAIISKDVFYMVQEKIKKDYLNKLSLVSQGAKYPLTNLVICSKCLRPMKRHYHNVGRPNKKVVLNCNHAPTIKMDRCPQKVLDSDLVQSALNDAINVLCLDKNLFNFIIEKLEVTLINSEAKEAINELEKKLANETASLDDYVGQKLSKLELNDDEFNETYIRKKKLIEGLKEQLSKEKYNHANRLITKNRTDMILSHIEQKDDFCDDYNVRSFFKAVFFDDDTGLTVILNDGTSTIEDFIINPNIIRNNVVLLEKTFFNKTLNKNIHYKVVSVNEPN